jgi:hypothetical protein
MERGVFLQSWAVRIYKYKRSPHSCGFSNQLFPSAIVSLSFLSQLTITMQSLCFSFSGRDDGIALLQWRYIWKVSKWITNSTLNDSSALTSLLTLQVAGLCEDWRYCRPWDHTRLRQFRWVKSQYICCLAAPCQVIMQVWHVCLQ